MVKETIQGNNCTNIVPTTMSDDSLKIFHFQHDRRMHITQCAFHSYWSLVHYLCTQRVLQQIMVFPCCFTLLLSTFTLIPVADPVVMWGGFSWVMLLIQNFQKNDFFTDFKDI